MNDAWIELNKKITVYTRRYKTEPKYLTEFLDVLTEELRLEKRVFSLEDFENIVETTPFFKKLSKKDRISAKWVGGSVATKTLEYYHPKFKTAIIVVDEHFKSK